MAQTSREANLSAKTRWETISISPCNVCNTSGPPKQRADHIKIFT